MSNEESSVRVAVRIRPQTPGEVVEGCSICAHANGDAGDGGITLGSERAFTFDYAFDPGAGQQQLYDSCVRKLVEESLDGYNATVLAYGQTGSGKTYTMGSGWEGEGGEEEDRRGIIPRAIRDLFAGADNRADEARAQGQLPPEFSVHAQFIELYNEDIVDLLDPARDTYAKGGLRITEDGCGGVRIVGASCRPVRGAKEALSVLRAGALARTTAATNMNSSSSRSHAVFTLMLRQRRLAVDQDGEKDEESPEQFEILTAKFHFVDLAGSERLKRTGATGDRAREGISINCGLLALGNVISALGDKSRKVSHVPYRDSKLTRLLQDSLGGNSNTVMIACVSPSDRDFMETLNTLKYANRARNIKNRCVLNQDLTSRTIHQLRQQVARLQLEIAEYKQGKRIISESGEEGWSDVVQENAILTGEVESLRRRVKAMQGTIDQLSTRNSELLADKALNKWGTNGEDTKDCSLTTLVQGYVREIEELRAQLLESNALYEASRKRETMAARNRHDSSLHDTNSVIDDAKRELYKEKEILARSMGELELSRSLSVGEGERQTIGERERAEGESADSDTNSDEEDEDAQNALSAELAALSGDIDTKQRLIEELELSQKRLQALKSHYEQRLSTLHNQIKATQEERDKVLASYATQSSPPSEKMKRLKDEYERRLSDLSKELKRLQSASKEHARLQRSQHQTSAHIHTLNAELRDMKRDKVKLVQRMRAESKRHAAAEAARAKEVAQLRKESRKNANLIRTLEAERRLKEQVLKRKQEEVFLLRRGHRDKLSSKASGRINTPRSRERILRDHWSRLERWLSRSIAARAMLSELECSLERALREREKVNRSNGLNNDSQDHLRYLNQTIADVQQQIMQLEEENDESELPQLLSSIEWPETGRLIAERLAKAALQHGHTSVANMNLLRDTRAQLKQMEENSERTASALRAVEDQNLNLNVWRGFSTNNLSNISSGSHTRPVSPADSSPIDRPLISNGVRESSTAPTSPLHSTPFQRNSVRRGSVRLRDLGVLSRDEGADLMTHSLLENSFTTQPTPLTRVPSAPGSLRGLTPVSSVSQIPSPISLRRAPPESPRPLRRQSSINKPQSLEISGSNSPSSPLARRRDRDSDADVFHRLTGTTTPGDHPPPAGVVKEYPVKRVSGPGIRLHCSHVAEGHVGAALALAASQDLLYSGGVDRTVRAWDMRGGSESWRGWAGAAVTSLCARGRCVASAANAIVRIYDTRTHTLRATLWSSGAVGSSVPQRGVSGEVAITALAMTDDGNRLYTAAGDKLRIWDLRMLECVGKIWSGHAAPVMCLSVRSSISSDLVCTGSKDHYVRIMDLQYQQNANAWESGSRRLLEPPHYDGVQAIALSDNVLYTASRDTSIKRWDLNSNAVTHSVMNAHKGWVTGVVCLGPVLPHSQNTLIASCARDSSLRVWDSRLTPLARTMLPDAAHALAHHPGHDANLVYTAGNGGDVRVWKVLAET